jgi:predicted secreted hydrolase
VKEGWSGPGRSDGRVMPLAPADDGLHTDLAEKGTYEWWYFDAHLEGGYTIVAFFYASNPNPGSGGKAGVELTLLRPDGTKTQRFIPHPKSQVQASTDKADVTIGRNSLKCDSSGPLPVYKLHLEGDGIGFDLVYWSHVKGWKPGSGYSNFEGMGYFAWVVPVPRAAVEGTIRDGEKIIGVKGVGYHDHNWLNFPFQRVIEYWMWGRLYSESFTASYAYIRCTPKLDNHTVKVLMLANDKDIIMSTGEFELAKGNFQFSPAAGYRYPKTLNLAVPGRLEIGLEVQQVLEQVNMLDNFNPLLRFLAGTVLRLKPGYFRLLSAFSLQLTQDGKTQAERGTAFHEIVAFKPTD